jgi:hypothetical protein
MKRQMARSTASNIRIQRKKIDCGSDGSFVAAYTGREYTKSSEPKAGDTITSVDYLYPDMPTKFKQWEKKSDGTIRLKWGSGKLCVTETNIGDGPYGGHELKLEKCSGSIHQKFEFYSTGTIGSTAYKGECWQAETEATVVV